jgi:hypothetical protein
MLNAIAEKAAVRKKLLRVNWIFLEDVFIVAVEKPGSICFDEWAGK